MRSEGVKFASFETHRPLTSGDKFDPFLVITKITTNFKVKTHIIINLLYPTPLSRLKFPWNSLIYISFPSLYDKSYAKLVTELRFP